MTEYIAIGVFLLVCSILNTSIKDNVPIASRLFLLLFIILALLCGLRENVGVDYESYKSIFQLKSDHSMSEIGFVGTINFINKLGGDYRLIFFIIALSTIYLNFKFIVNCSPYIFFSILIYYCVGNYYLGGFNAIRQALAASIFINSLALIKNREHIKYGIVIIFITLFVHFTACLLYMLYYVLNHKAKLLTYVITTFIVSLCNGVAIPIIEASPYAIYLKLDFDSTIPLTYYFMFCISIILFYVMYKDNKWRQKNIILFNLNFIVFLLLGLMLIYEGTPLVMILNRLVWYFTIIYVVIIPKIIFRLQLPRNRMVLIAFLSVFFLLWNFLALKFGGKENMMTPYTSIFDYL